MKSSPKSRNKKDIFINESAVNEMIHIYCFQTCGAHIKKTATISLEQLLIQAGDVEMNPGPRDSIIPLKESELLSLAHDISPQYYDSFCCALGIPHSRSQSILLRNCQDFYGSFVENLYIWRWKQIDGSNCRRALAEILRHENFDVLAEKISQGTDKQLTEQYTPSPTTVEIPTKEYSEKDSDNLLKKVAKQIHKEIDIDNLGVELGFERSEIQRYIQANRIGNTVTYMGTLDMLYDWRNKTTKSEEREKLKKALIAIGQIRLVDDLLNDDMPRITDKTLGNTGFASPRPSPSTSVAIPFQDASAAAGEVSTARARVVGDAMLNRLAGRIPSYAYDTFSEKLGIKHTQAQNILDKYNRDYEKATRECITKWRDRSTRSVADLHDVL